MVVLNNKSLKGLFSHLLIYLSLVLAVVWSLEGRVVEAEARKKTGLKVGNLAPDFVLSDMTGKQVRLSDFRGKSVILNFWSTWCKPCVEEMPDMQTFYDKNNMAGIDILAVNINRERDSTVKDFAQRLNLTFSILLDFDKIVARKYKVFVLPTSFLISENGVIAKKWYGKMDLDKEAFLLEIRKTSAIFP